jgi:EAL domain-containing protein (putative c-di-GMP-specific phosphodiesterase class I)
MSSHIRHIPKIIVCGHGDRTAAAAALIRDRFGCQTATVENPLKLLDRVYEEMPSIIIALLQGPRDPLLTVLRTIKQDAVLEFIPMLLAVPEEHPHEMYGFDQAAIVDRDRTDKMVMAVTLILLEVEHQLDVNPFTGLAGHHTSIEKIQIALDIGGPHTLCSVRVRGMEIFAGQRGSMSADVLFGRMIEEMRRCFESVAGGNGFLGHLGRRTFVAALSDENARKFADEITRFFDANYEALEAYATQEKFMTSKDPLAGRYSRTAPVTVSVALLPLAGHEFRHAAELMSAAEAVHAAHSGLSGNVIGGSRPADVRPDVQADGDGKRAEGGDAELVRRFLEPGRIETYFQPIVDLWEGRVFAYEALTRFKEADGTFTHPLIIFEAARTAGLIKELDLACVRSALLRYGTLNTEAKLFLNLNRETFISMEDHIQEIDLTCVKGERLVIELTEQSIVGERAKVLAVKNRLLELGVGIAFDDAGTGEVSFREVGEIRPAYVKFDRQLVSGITRSALKQRHVLSMRAFARGIGARTIAEGIELSSEFNYFRGARLDFGQGYLIGKPKPDPDRTIDLRKVVGG